MSNIYALGRVDDVQKVFIREIANTCNNGNLDTSDITYNIRKHLKALKELDNMESFNIVEVIPTLKKDGYKITKLKEEE